MPEIINPTGPNLIELSIKMDPRTNQIGLNGPLDNKVLCYGLLMMAHDILIEHHRKLAEGNRITPVTLIPGN